MSDHTAANLQQPKQLKLYWDPICPFVHKALITIHEKQCADQIAFVRLDLAEGNKGNFPDWFKAINPKETIPVLTVDGVPVFESEFICEYIDHNFGPQDMLSPKDAQLRAEIREFELACGGLTDGMLGALFAVMQASGADLKRAIAKATPELKKVNDILVARHKLTPGPFLFGQQLSLADVHVIPFLHRFNVLLPAMSEGFDLFEHAPELRLLFEAARTRASVFLTAPTYEEYMRFYPSYAGKTSVTPALPVLRGNEESYFVQSVRIAAEFAKLDLTYEAGACDPSITFRGTTVAGSTYNAVHFLLESDRHVIAECPPLNPLGSVEYCRAEYIAKAAEALASDLTSALQTNNLDNVTEAINDLESNLLGDGPFAVGSEPSFADAVIVPVLNELRDVSQRDTLKTAPKLMKLFDAACRIGNVASIVFLPPQAETSG